MNEKSVEPTNPESITLNQSLSQFKESIDPYYAFPPSDGVHRIIAKDEAEVRHDNIFGSYLSVRQDNINIFR